MEATMTIRVAAAYVPRRGREVIGALHLSAPDRAVRAVAWRRWAIENGKAGEIREADVAVASVVEGG